MSLLLREFVKFKKKEEVMRMENMEKIAQAIEDTWLSLYNIAHEIGISRELGRAEVLFKFAKNLLQDPERMMDSKFTIGIDDNEVYIRATFDGVHLHTVFLSPNSPISRVKEEFVKPEIALKSAINILIEAIEETLYVFKRMKW
jgi:hypothetical protein